MKNFHIHVHPDTNKVTKEIVEYESWIMPLSFQIGGMIEMQINSRSLNVPADKWSDYMEHLAGARYHLDRALSCLKYAERESLEIFQPQKPWEGEVEKDE